MCKDRRGIIGGLIYHMEEMDIQAGRHSRTETLPTRYTRA